MYAKTKSLSGFNMYTDNAAGTIVQYQAKGAPPNVWEYLDTVTEENNSLFPNASTEDTNVLRLRINGNSKGTPIVFHGTEVLMVDDKGFEQN